MRHLDDPRRRSSVQQAALAGDNELKQRTFAKGFGTTHAAGSSEANGNAAMPSRSGVPTSSFDKHTVFRRHSLFGQLGEEAINRLVSYSRSKSVAAGTTIFERGDLGACLFAVCAGTVKIRNHSTEGKDAVLNLIHAGEIFGEIALLDGRPRTASAVAVTDCELMVIDRRELAPMIASMPDLALKLIEILCNRVRHTSEQVEDVMFLGLSARLAKTLLSLAEDTDASRGRKISITQREIGQIIGMSRESTNKQLRSWEARNWLRLQRGSIVILDARPLKDIAAAGADDIDEPDRSYQPR